MAKDKMAKVGKWAFILGVIIALIAGLVSSAWISWTTSILIVLGLIVGLLNVTGKETTPFLLAAVSLVIVANFGGQMLGSIAIVGPYIGSILASIMTFVMPATIIVALKAVYALAKDV